MFHLQPTIVAISCAKVLTFILLPSAAFPIMSLLAKSHALRGKTLTSSRLAVASRTLATLQDKQNGQKP